MNPGASKGSCLTCLYMPHWSAAGAFVDKRKAGYCTYPLPLAVEIRKMDYEACIRDEKTMNCPTWQPKMEAEELRLDDAYFLVNDDNNVAFVPLGMIASLHIVQDKNCEDLYCNVVLTTVSGKEFIHDGMFTSWDTAIEFCKEQMREISNYRKALALAGVNDRHLPARLNHA